MPTEVILPKVDMDMTHGTLAVWHVAEGEMVTKGAALFDIETDKAAMEVEAPASGRLTNSCNRFCIRSIVCRKASSFSASVPCVSDGSG